MEPTFEQAAFSYDQSFTFSPIGRLQRQAVWDYLKQNFQHASRLNVLELTCGTGEDALFWTKLGHTVIATDQSPAMLSVVQHKIIQSGENTNIETRVLDLNEFPGTLLGDQFDLIFSNFGGLNCIDYLTFQRIVDFFPSLIKPQGRVILVVMPRFCLWEQFYFLVKLNPKRAFVRLKRDAVKVQLEAKAVYTWYYSPREIYKLFSKKFQLVHKKPIGFFIPPSYLNPFFQKRPKLLSFLNKLEKRVSSFSLLASFSDHFLIDYRLK